MRPAEVAVLAPGEHPQDRYRDRPEGIEVLALGGSTADEPPIVRRIRTASRSAIVGARQSDEEFYIGGLGGAAIDDRGRIFLLDSRLNKVIALAPTGELLAEFGGPGQGPGEFVSPTSISLNPQASRIFVGDRNSKVHVFSIGDSGAEFLESIRLNGSIPDALCALGEELVVGSGDFKDGVVRIHDRNGRQLREFGTLYRSPHFVVNGQLADVVVGCDPTRQRIVVAAEVLGEVRSFGSDGNLDWIWLASGFRSVTVTPTDATHASIVVPESGFDAFDSIAIAPGGIAIVQYSHWKMHDTGRTRERTVSFAISVETGESWDLGDQVPRIVAISDRFMVVEPPALDPYVEIFELGHARDDHHDK